MITRRTHSLLSYYAWLGVWLVWFSGEPNRSALATEIRGDRTLLERITVTHVSNRQTLATWEGDVRVDAYTKQGEDVDERTAEVRFAYDRDRLAWRYHWTYVKTPSHAFDGLQTGGLFLDNTWHSFGPYQPGKTGQSVAVRAGAAPEIGPLASEFDPMYYFKVNDDQLEEWTKHWTVHGDTTWLSLVIERDADLVTITESNVTIPGPSARYVFDLSKSGNLQSLIARDDEREVRWTTRWENRAGCWVPELATYENVMHDGSQVLKRSVTWVRSAVNEALAADAFSLETLGVERGALISDHRVKESSFYKEDSGRDKPAHVERRGSTAVIVGLNISLLMTVFGYFVWRRRHRTTIQE